MAGQSPEKAGQQPAQRQVAALELKVLKARQHLEERKCDHQQPDHQLDGRNLHDGAAVDVDYDAAVRLREPAEGQRAEHGRRDRRQPEFDHHLAVRVAAEKRNLEDVVGPVHQRRGHDRQLDREKQREHRQHQRAEAEAGVQRETGGEAGRQADNQVADCLRHRTQPWRRASAAYSSTARHTRSRLPPMIASMSSSEYSLSRNCSISCG